MKNLPTLAATLLLGAALLACTPNKAQQEPSPADTTVAAPDSAAMLTMAVDRYLCDTIGALYEPADACIPCTHIVKVDQSNPDDVRMWGIYYVYNYNIAGDTLKCVSGGCHPGLLHLKKTPEGYTATRFDRVADGAGNVESARRIFGDDFEAYQSYLSDDVKREQDRAAQIADYVKDSGAKVTLYQDYGWPAREIPLR